MSLFSQAVSLTAGSTYTQDFNTLSNTAGSTTNNLTITGWYMTETGGGARDNEQYAVDNGVSTIGDTYSYGASGSTERALGSVQSGTLIPTFGACFNNNTGKTISALIISYTGEQWRLGTAARTDAINFEYSINATWLEAGTWISVPALNFTTPVTVTTGAKNGDAADCRTSLSGIINGLAIPNGTSFWIRWKDMNASGADDGLAVDDFSIQTIIPVDITFTPGSAYIPPIAAPGSIDNVIGRMCLTGDLDGASLTSLMVDISGVHSGITSLKLWSSADEVFDPGSDQTLAASSDGVLITFDSFLSEISTSGTYYFITADLAADAVGEVTAAITDGSSFTFTGGSLVTTVNNDQLSQSSTALPVELISFNSMVEKNTVTLYWVTATEVNNYGFEIERRAPLNLPKRETSKTPLPLGKGQGDGLWQLVGFVEGNGNSNSNKNYIFTDKSPAAGINYYRLKQIDNDGKYEYSSIVEAEVLSGEFSLGQNYPNPCNPDVTISYNIPEDCNVSLKLYDITGREVLNPVNEFKPAGFYDVKFITTEFSSGIYIIKLTAGKFSAVRKLSILK